MFHWIFILLYDEDVFLYVYNVKLLYRELMQKTKKTRERSLIENCFEFEFCIHGA